MIEFNTSYDKMAQNDEEYDLIFENKRFKFFPSVGLKLTGACRINCPFCCEPNRAQDTFPVANFIKISKALHSLGTKRLCLTGGDPLLYPALPELLKYTHQLGLFNLLLTGDGELLKKKYKEFYNYIDSVRFSVHAIGHKHDSIVNHEGAFYYIDCAIDLMNSIGVKCQVTTVVTTLNVDNIVEIAEWCARKNIKTYFLFGLMRSGNGFSFIENNGIITYDDIKKIIYEINNKYPVESLEVVLYEYRKNAECVLIYGDGRVIIDPYPIPPLFQLEIGNILTEETFEIRKRFLADPENQKGHSEHLKRYDKSIGI